MKLSIGEQEKTYYLLDCNGNYEWVDSYEEGCRRLAEKEKAFPDDEWELFDSDDDSEWNGYQKF